MLITLWQGSAHRHGEEHVSSPSEVKVNIIAISHFLLMLQLLTQLNIVTKCDYNN